MTSTTCDIIYQHDCIRIGHDKERDYYSVVAECDIAVGTLVLLEYPVSGTEKTLMGALIIDQAFRDELYPRSENDDIAEKVMTNSFKFDANLVLGRVISKFNHSCTPNCHVAMADFCNNDKVYGVWVHRPVQKGQELTLDYVNHGSVEYHDKMKEKHGFECSCTKQYILDNEKRADIHMNMSGTFRERNLGFIQERVNLYFAGKKGRAVYKAQRDACKLAKKIKIIGV
jgi:hypothetical protein